MAMLAQIVLLCAGSANALVLLRSPMPCRQRIVRMEEQEKKDSAMGYFKAKEQAALKQGGWSIFADKTASQKPEPAWVLEKREVEARRKKRLESQKAYERENGPIPFWKNVDEVIGFGEFAAKIEETPSSGASDAEAPAE
mmetsp:Transcript_71929/g.160029  ORF Transcript_71929/g.160029 Transcript_71929/m.160029 type:complete len:140 (-) Transcript_71929:478-897(-)|eukprot:CAMPEP_0181182622 /NCGR_PEP_ID=MMETSP1096-20121128/7990_1 /TAXON_ID=156174 ORGANISM="Chrysochromulina ericina, Strain CCMP281" /NCGR_SAMPLE_ID=MMETSP1096 /ASSEMBLY_ACC=CAM_ASM_000453 /LENGTH=139 /DNA_ID=CAMNT_0023271247 /DNA_START=22 /DNA_END=441 /DNA_ORIENTATION=-